MFAVVCVTDIVSDAAREDARTGSTGVLVTLTEKNQCRRFGCFLRSQMKVFELQYAVLADDAEDAVSNHYIHYRSEIQFLLCFIWRSAIPLKRKLEPEPDVYIWL